jgi:uncharacterized membrane protein
MKPLIDSFKATALGGVLFLIPTTVAVLVVVEVLDFLEIVTEPLAELMGARTVLGATGANLIGLLLIALLCFAVGLFARGRAGQRILGTVEKGLLSALPGYAVLKGMVDTVVGNEERAKRFKPVMVRGAASSRLAYEVERTPSGPVVVFMPDAPNPWSGSVQYVDPERVQAVDIPVHEVPRILEQLGIGSGQYLGLGSTAGPTANQETAW